MPNKGKKAASRQARLSLKKRGAKSNVQRFDLGPSRSEKTVVGQDTQSVEDSTDSNQQVKQTINTKFLKDSPAGQSMGQLNTYPYLGIELRRIAIMTVIILGILAAISLLLGD